MAVCLGGGGQAGTGSWLSTCSAQAGAEAAWDTVPGMSPFLELALPLDVSTTDTGRGSSNPLFFLALWVVAIHPVPGFIQPCLSLPSYFHLHKA